MFIGPIIGQTENHINNNGLGGIARWRERESEKLRMSDDSVSTAFDILYRFMRMRPRMLISPPISRAHDRMLIAMKWNPH